MGLEVKDDRNDTELDIDTSFVEGMDTLENDKPVELKEYQKLLMQDENRELANKAYKLIKLGLWNQYKVSVDDFNIKNLKKLDFVKKYKGHELYQGEHNELYYIASLSEEDSDNPTAQVYSYDIVELDNVDEETYKKLIEAHKHEGNKLLSICYYISIVVTVVAVASFVYTLLFGMINKGYNLFDSLFIYAIQPLFYAGALASLVGILHIFKRRFEGR
jgi:hypothetical protein